MSCGARCALFGRAGHAEVSSCERIHNPVILVEPERGMLSYPITRKDYVPTKDDKYSHTLLIYALSSPRQLNEQPKLHLGSSCLV